MPSTFTFLTKSGGKTEETAPPAQPEKNHDASANASKL